MNARSDDIEDLYLDARPGLIRRVARRLGCQAVAADLVQDVFLRLWERSDAPVDDAAAYVNRSLNNAVVDHMRAERVRREFVARTLPEQHAPPQPSPLDIVEARDEVRQLDETLRRLPERTRHIFLLNRVHGRTYSEIAEALGISRSAVEKHMARAMVGFRIAGG